MSTESGGFMKIRWGCLIGWVMGLREWLGGLLLWLFGLAALLVFSAALVVPVIVVSWVGAPISAYRVSPTMVLVLLSVAVYGVVFSGLIDSLGQWQDRFFNRHPVLMVFVGIPLMMAIAPPVIAGLLYPFGILLGAVLGAGPTSTTAALINFFWAQTSF